MLEKRPCQYFITLTSTVFNIKIQYSRFNISAWYGNLNIQNKLHTILNAAIKVIGLRHRPQKSASDIGLRQTLFGKLFGKNIQKKTKKILEIKKKTSGSGFCDFSNTKEIQNTDYKDRHKNFLVPLGQ